MTKIYADSEEKFVKAVVLYGKTSNDYLHMTPECTEEDKLDKDTLMTLVHKGVIIKYDDAFYAPVAYKENAGALEVDILKAASAFTTLYSKEHAMG